MSNTDKDIDKLLKDLLGDDSADDLLDQELGLDDEPDAPDEEENVITASDEGSEDPLEPVTEAQQEATEAVFDEEDEPDESDEDDGDDEFRKLLAGSGLLDDGDDDLGLDDDDDDDDEDEDGGDQLDPIYASGTQACASCEAECDPSELDKRGVCGTCVSKGFDSEEEVTAAVTPEDASEKVVSATPPPTPKVTQAPRPVFTSDELAETLDLREYAVLVNLESRRWHAKLKDKEAAQAAADAVGADSDAYESKKNLLVGARDKLKAVHKAIDDARTTHYSLTLPWSRYGIQDSGKRQGARLLPNDRYFRYVKAMAGHMQEVQQAVDEFCNNFPKYVQIAQQHLGTAFDASEYPSVSEIRSRFGLDFDFSPIPKGNDFQGLTDAAVQKLADKLEERSRTMAENAMQELWDRAYELVERAHTNYNKPDAKWHFTLPQKLNQLPADMRELNVTKDDRIERLADDIEKHLTGYEADAIREDDALKRRLGEAATRILKDMEEIANG